MKIRKIGIPEGYKPYYTVSLGYKTSNKNRAIARPRNQSDPVGIKFRKRYLII
jgi:hypothetical protein